MSIDWTYKGGCIVGNEAYRVYRNDELKVQCEVVTRQRANGEWLTGKTYYFIDDDPREFHDEADLLEALDDKPWMKRQKLCAMPKEEA